MKPAPNITKLGALAAMAAAAAAIAGCGSSNATNPSSAKISNSTFARAADVSSSAAGEKVAMSLTEDVDSHQISMTGSGAFNRSPSAGQMTMNIAEAGNAIGALNLVIDHGTIYMKLPSSLSGELSTVTGGKPWMSINIAQLGSAENVPGLSSLFNQNEVNPAQELKIFADSSTNGLSKVGTATINGVSTTEYKATLDLSKVANAVPAAQRATIKALLAKESSQTGTKVPVEVWIDGDNLVRQFIESPTLKLDGQTVAMHVKMDITSYGKQPAPTVPAASETYDMTHLIEQAASSGGLSGLGG